MYLQCEYIIYNGNRNLVNIFTLRSQYNWPMSSTIYFFFGHEYVVLSCINNLIYFKWFFDWWHMVTCLEEGDGVLCILATASLGSSWRRCAAVTTADLRQGSHARVAESKRRFNILSSIYQYNIYSQESFHSIFLGMINIYTDIFIITYIRNWTQQRTCQTTIIDDK